MAEYAVVFVLEKLTTLLEEKVILIKEVKQEVEYVRDELERMTAFLRVADSAEDTDPELKVWVKQVRDLAHETEDIIDEFMLHLHYPNGCCSFKFCGFLEKLILSVRNLRTHYAIASQIQTIKSRMTEIAVGHRRYRYKFADPNQESSLSGSIRAGIDRRDDALLLEEFELVGIENPKKELVFLLLEGGLGLKVVSVVGMGGLGKTTLVKKVFDDAIVKKQFQNHAWITVSQSFKVDEVLRDTIQQLFDQMKLPLPQDLSFVSGNRLKTMVKEFLQQRKYMLVFDDVWNVQAWEAIKYVLPNEDQGSRVIVTTRLMDVALACVWESDGYVYELNPLSEQESWILFCQKAFQGDKNSCPTHLIDICKKILGRCGGLPLAIVAIGGVLSTKKDSNIDEWKMLNYSLGCELEGNDQLESLRNILLLSFNFLPHYLKPCFMYLSCYPEDYTIEHNTLIRQLIAEGFVRQKDGRALEEIAQRYLNELVNRSLLRPVKINDDGSVKESCIHEFYREIILSKSRDQNFSAISTEQNMVWPKRVRRLCIHGAIESLEIERYGNKLSSLLTFNVKDSQSVSSIVNLLKKCRMLKVLDLRGVPVKKFPKAILQLLHLKSLCLRNTLIESLPESIKNLHKLEMLDLKETYVTELPLGILKLIRLRQLLVYHHVPSSYMSYHYVNGFKALKGMGNLKSLQKLCFIEASLGSNVLKEIAEMSELKRLSITMLRTEDCLVLSSSIEKLGKLCSLGLRAVEGDFLDLEYISSPPRFLQRLYLGGRLAKFPQWIQNLRSLVKVYFRWSKLSDDPLEYLQDLPNLVHIEFLDAFIGEKLCFKSGQFQKLKLLGLDRLEALKQVIIEEGSVSCLEKFIIQRCKSLESVPIGIERLSNLKVLEFFDMPEEFIRPISPQGDEHLKIARIPEVYHTYWRNGSWEVHPLEGQLPKVKSGNSIVRTQEQRNWL